MIERHLRRGAICAAALWICATSVALAQSARHGHASTAGLKGDARIEALLSRMTLEEKLGQLTQVDGRLGAKTPPDVPPPEEQIRQGRVGSFLGVSGADNTRRFQRLAVEESRLGIPLLFADDVIHGFRTIFPVPLGEAASFDVAGVERSARIAAIEAAAHGIHWTYAPMVDIARDPRWGRIVEGSGEDPYLGSLLAAARVRGFQGGDVANADTLLATAKHFVAYGAAEGGRDYNLADISQRTLYETYLPPFRAAVDAGVQSVMAAFNEIGGVPMHANRELTRGVLRGQWGFNGIVISDYNGVHELTAHGVAENDQAAGTVAMNAGVDIDMASNTYFKELPGALREKRVAGSDLDDAVRRVLRAKERMGLFDDPYRYSDATREAERTLTPQHREAARGLARESMVLLKNEGNLLPLSRQLRSIAVIGPLADSPVDIMGSWSAVGRAEDAITPLEGIRRAVGRDTRILYAKGTSIDGNDTSGFAEAQRIAGEADAIVLFLGEAHDMSGEARSRSSLGIPGRQDELARIVKASGKPFAVVLFCGRPLTIGWLADNASSILLAWFAGVEGGNAIADVLFGDYNPSGRLPVTFPRVVGQVPIYYNHRNTGRPPQADTEFGSRYLDVPWTPQYVFGYGLSYTKFAYRNLRLSSERIGRDGGLEVRVDVRNEGGRAGDEVAQLYLRDDVASVARPVKELRGFQRIHLRAGESRTLTFSITPDDLAFYGLDMRRVVEPGTFTVFVGGSSEDVIQAAFAVE
jgi:beta-glucosidase